MKTNKKEYTFYQDEKQEVWVKHEFAITANSKKEAIEIAKEYANFPITSSDKKDITILSTEVIPNTSKLLTIKKNKSRTLETFTSDHTYLCSNDIEYIDFLTEVRFNTFKNIFRYIRLYKEVEDISIHLTDKRLDYEDFSFMLYMKMYGKTYSYKVYFLYDNADKIQITNIYYLKSDKDEDKE